MNKNKIYSLIPKSNCKINTISVLFIGFSVFYVQNLLFFRFLVFLWTFCFLLLLLLTREREKEKR